MTLGASWALRAYPPSFRDRYGAEVAALTEGLPPSWRHTADLYAGAARAWLRPVLTGPDSTQHRLQASVSTVWMAWCAGFLLAPAMSKALLDPPAPHVDATVRRLLDGSATVFLAGWVVALAGASVIVARALLPALRARHWRVLRPLLPSLVLGAIEAVGLLALASTARSDASRPTTMMIALVSAWLVGLLALVVCSGFGANLAIRRLRPTGDVLRVPVLLAAVLSVCLVAMTATCAAAALIAGDASLVGTFAPVATAVAVGVVASATAVVSSTRGVLALLC